MYIYTDLSYHSYIQASPNRRYREKISQIAIKKKKKKIGQKISPCLKSLYLKSYFNFTKTNTVFLSHTFDVIVL